ncbi:MAG: CatB-related O-acetyltransferase [Pseudomonadota bacterium]
MLPDPTTRHPLVLPNGTVDEATVFLNQVIDHPNIEIGNYTYYNDATRPKDYAKTLVPYLFPGAPERVKIGKFCQFAEGLEIITTTANHPMHGVSTYPFMVFDQDRFASYVAALPPGRDTIIGHDCWFGRKTTVLPGARIGNGVIVGAKSVVGGRVPDFAVVAGNPAKTIRHRFRPETVAQLNAIAWWNWPAERIESALPAIEQGDIAALAKA